jgi:hypothetical protein
MFDTDSKSSLATRHGWLPKIGFFNVRLSPTEISTSSAPLDVRNLRGLAVLLEAKSCPIDTVRLQHAICQQFQGLISSQILFRRRATH